MIEMKCRRCGMSGIMLVDEDAVSMTHYSARPDGSECADGTGACHGPCVIAGAWGNAGGLEALDIDRLETSGVIMSALALGWDTGEASWMTEVINAYAARDGGGSVSGFDEDDLGVFAEAWLPEAEAWLRNEGLLP